MVTTPTLWKNFTQVNTSDAPAQPDGTAIQADGQLVALDDGGYVVVWTDFSRTHNATGSAIVAQKFDAFGNKVGDEVKVSLATGENFSPAVTLLSTGNIAVAYVGQPGAEGDIFVRVLDANLNSVRTDSIETSAVHATSPAITALANGKYLVSYTLEVSATHQDVIGRIVDANGTAGDAIDINNELDTSGASQVAMLSNGNVVVAYHDKPDAGGTDDNVEFAILSPTGQLAVSQRLVQGADGAGISEANPDVAALKGGGFVVTWTESGLDENGDDIRATVYDNDGNVVNSNAGPGILVNTTRAGNQNEASVVALNDGGFFITWEDDANNAVRGQRYDANGNRIGLEVKIKDGLGVDNPDSALLSDGRIAFALGDVSSGDPDVTTGIFDPRTSPINGTNGNDVLTSRREGATVNGLDGDDFLFGLNGNDVLRGGAGFDELAGGRGKDTMFGGPGSDYFIFSSIKDAGRGKKADIIKGFSHVDRIGLYDIDANAKKGGFQQFKFIGKKDFHKKAGELHYVKDGKKHVVVEGDVNGDGKADFQIHVFGAGKLNLNDFDL